MQSHGNLKYHSVCFSYAFSLCLIRSIQGGHALLIPKKHYVTLLDMPDELLAHFNKISKKIYKSILDNIKCDGITVIQNNGSCQDVKHYHVHFVPRYDEDKAIKYAQFGNKDILKDIQETIKEVIRPLFFNNKLSIEQPLIE